MPQPLATYLNDHLAGSVAALAHLGRSRAGTPLGAFFAGLRARTQHWQGLTTRDWPPGRTGSGGGSRRSAY